MLLPTAGRAQEVMTYTYQGTALSGGTISASCPSAASLGIVSAIVSGTVLPTTLGSASADISLGGITLTNTSANISLSSSGQVTQSVLSGGTASIGDGATVMSIYLVTGGTASGEDQVNIFVSALNPVTGQPQPTLCSYISAGPGSWSFSGAQTTSTNNLGNGTPGDDLSTPCDGGKAPSSNVYDPINIFTGNLFETETDLTCAPHTGISFTRYYNSQDGGGLVMGIKWHSTWHRGLSVSGNTVTVTRADGEQDVFTNTGAGFAANANVTNTLVAKTNGYALTLSNDNVETYNAAGQLLTITTRAGRVTTLAYDAAGHLTKVTGPFGHVIYFTYDTMSRVKTMKAPDGGIYAYAYDAHGNLVSVTYPGGAKRQYQYGNATFPNALTGVIDELGNLYTSIAYDGQGRAVTSGHANGAELASVAYNNGASTVTDANGNQYTVSGSSQSGLLQASVLTGAPEPSFGGQAFSYDAGGFLAGRQDFDGNITAYTHDARGNELSRTDAYGTPLARVTSTTWLSTFHLPNRIVEPTGRTTTFTYDARGNLLTKSVAAGGLTRSWTYTYNTMGQVLTERDPLGHVTAYAYDAMGNVASMTDALGHKTVFTAYDGAGRLLSFRDPNGLVTTMTYDLRGNLLTRTAGGEKTSFAYDAANNLIRKTAPDGSYITYVYDAAHRLTHTVDALNNQLALTLDGNGNRTSAALFDPAAHLAQTRSFGYDLVNRLIQETGAQNQVTRYAYDPEGNLTGVTDPLSHTTAYAYDALNRKTATTDAANGQTKFTYDALDHLTGETDPRGLATACAYDGLDDQTATTSPDTGLSVKTYDAFGNIATSTDARGKKTTYTYDALNRVTKAAYADGSAAVYQYDQGTNGIGHLTQMADKTGTTLWSYDQHGRITQKTQKSGNAELTTQYAYDTAGRLAAMAYPSGKKIALSYDAAGHVNGIAKNGVWIVSNIAYRPFGPASAWREGNGAALVRAFDADGRIAAIGLGATAKQQTAHMLSFAYDPASRITAMTETGEPDQAYGYDALDRLTGYVAGAGNAGQTITYNYDADGNRTGQSATGGMTPGAISYGYAANSNRLLQTKQGTGRSEKTFELSYDATGNLLSDGIHEWTYDAKGRMASVTRDIRGLRDNERIESFLATDYAVNGLGQRVAKHQAIAQNLTERHYAYDNAGHMIGEYDRLGRVSEETIYLGDIPVAVMQGSAKDCDGWFRNQERDDIFYIASDQLQAPHIITDSEGREVWSWHHDPFGNGQPSSTVEGFSLLSYDQRFPGQTYDEETGTNYNMARDYNPATGRYIQSDPLGLAAGVNTYGYVGGNPVNRIDPRGLQGIPPQIEEFVEEEGPALVEEAQAELQQLENYFTSNPQNAASAGRLQQQLTCEQASANTASNGELTQETLNMSTPIKGYGPGELGNPSIPSNFGKYTTQVFDTPYGPAQTHFYMDPATNEVLYYPDYKSKFLP